MGNLMTPVKTWEFLGKKIHRKVDFFQPEPEAVRLATTKQTRWPPENQVFLMGWSLTPLIGGFKNLRYLIYFSAIL